MPSIGLWGWPEPVRYMAGSDSIRHGRCPIATHCTKSSSVSASSASQSDDTPSRHFPRCSQRAMTEVFTTHLRPIDVYVATAAIGSPLSPNSTSHTIGADLSSLKCRKSASVHRMIRGVARKRFLFVFFTLPSRCGGTPRPSKGPPLSCSPTSAPLPVGKESYHRFLV